MNGTLTLREGFVASRELQNGISNQYTVLRCTENSFSSVGAMEWYSESNNLSIPRDR